MKRLKLILFIVIFFFTISETFGQVACSCRVMFHLSDSTGKIIKKQQLLDKEYDIKISCSPIKPYFTTFLIDSLTQSIYFHACYSPPACGTVRILIINKADTMKIDIFADILPKPLGSEDYYNYEIDTVKSSYGIRFNKGSFVLIKNNDIFSLLDRTKMTQYQIQEYNILFDDYWINLSK